MYFAQLIGYEPNETSAIKEKDGLYVAIHYYFNDVERTKNAYVRINAYLSHELGGIACTDCQLKPGTGDYETNVYAGTGRALRIIRQDKSLVVYIGRTQGVAAMNEFFANLGY